jgi:hypothetical protein
MVTRAMPRPRLPSQTLRWPVKRCWHGKRLTTRTFWTCFYYYFTFGWPCEPGAGWALEPLLYCASCFAFAARQNSVY